ncbi:MAG: iron-sulfur cluster assembly protein [Prevotellaceae bacterium]|jgi:FeS assembly SUF system protein|nr:iron-sulfur cluster assembly protein [Prevotellaceae bacterium]
MSKFEIEQNIVKVLKNIYDPEIPVNIYDLGLIYNVDANDDGKVILTMTLTAPNCPVADEMVENVRSELKDIPEVTDVEINLTFEPPWDMNYLSDEAKLELGML